MLLFDAFLIWKKVAHSIRRSFVGKKKFHSANARYAIETMPKNYLA
ncbi:hypothetical protein PMI09_03441 [Rhizobium sp. CF122]|nr:hypothetical protein PMI09_03441 [Rhizobium sp. CF122]